MAPTLDWLLPRLAAHGHQRALISGSEAIRYSDLVASVLGWNDELDSLGVLPGESIAIVGNYSPNVVGLLIAAIERGAIVVPLTNRSYSLFPRSLDVACVTRVIEVTPTSYDSYVREDANPEHEMLKDLRQNGEAGLILFTSGSTGERKAPLLSFNRLLERFQTPRSAHRTLVFLMFDHIGGLNTLFHTLCNGGTVVTVDEPSVGAVCTAIAEHDIELLPTTPSFLNMLLLSGEHQKHDLSSLKLVTYGTEPMPFSSLRALAAEFPDVKFKQTYGLSELGIMQTKSRDSDSLWMKVGGDGIETRIVDGILHIRTASAMRGYLNAPSPFDSEGWFNTQDEVDVDGEFIRVKGRTSEIINVAGEKVYPAEVESVLMEVPNVQNALVYAKKNAVVGSVVAAKISPREPEPDEVLIRRVKEYCRERLAPYQIPVLILVTDEIVVSDRFKKSRLGAGVAASANV
ncbi:MAG: fatty acid--CoA ligase family protein [Pseudomonadota bacterium]|nr:long-chain fatty acid--CoA ligase [Gammaproteobacteria bacterium]MDQ3581338.1 fatty acid--CoA ligase family protein [Pseudomonadota bacterium]